ncbi:5516_t:CDS:1, partial [Racocetra fulgida]
KVKDISKFGTNNAKMVPSKSNAKVVLAEIDIKDIDGVYGHFYIKNKDELEEYEIRKSKASDKSRVSLVSKTNDASVINWLFITIDEDVYLVKHKYIKENREENIDVEILEMAQDKFSAIKLLLKEIISKYNNQNKNEDIDKFDNEIKKFDKETKAYVDILQTGFLNYIVYSHRSDKEKMFNNEVENVPNGNSSSIF